MDEDQNALAEELSGDNEDIENGGVGLGDAEEAGNNSDGEGLPSEDPYGIKKRLGMQAKKHAREMRQMQEQMMQMQAHLSSGDSANPQYTDYNQTPYSSPGQPNPPATNEEERIQRAVRLALGMKDHEEQQAKIAERQANVQKQYKRLK